MPRVRYSYRAERDLAEILSFISEDWAERAFRIGVRFDRQIRSLEKLPERGRIRLEFGPKR